MRKVVVAEHGRRLENTGFFGRAAVERDHPGPKYAQRFLQIADRDRKSAGAFQALYLACLVDNADGAADSLNKALARILEDYAAGPWLRSAIPGLSGVPHKSVPAFLRQVVEVSLDRTVKGTACFYLAMERKATDRPDAAEILALLKRCSDEFGDVDIELDDETSTAEIPLAMLVKPMIFEAENLSVGCRAPEIVGKDIDGQTMKLSEFRGKVVVLDFFADWCPHCVRMYPEERHIARTMADKPIALLGVNCDGEDTLRQIRDDQKVTWQCWSDGTSGPIAAAWQVRGFPMMYVIDQDGIIRHKFSGATPPGKLKQAVEELVDALLASKAPAVEVGEKPK